VWALFVRVFGEGRGRKATAARKLLIVDGARCCRAAIAGVGADQKEEPRTPPLSPRADGVGERAATARAVGAGSRSRRDGPGSVATWRHAPRPARKGSPRCKDRYRARRRKSAARRTARPARRP